MLLGDINNRARQLQHRPRRLSVALTAKWRQIDINMRPDGSKNIPNVRHQLKGFVCFAHGIRTHKHSVRRFCRSAWFSVEAVYFFLFSISALGGRGKSSRTAINFRLECVAAKFKNDPITFNSLKWGFNPVYLIHLFLVLQIFIYKLSDFRFTKSSFPAYFVCACLCDKRAHSEIHINFLRHSPNLAVRCVNNVQVTLCVWSIPTSCGKQMTNDSTQTPATNILARFVDMMLGYVTGRVTATYRSSEMAHRFRIDAVHIHTSKASHILHHKSPKIHIWKQERRQTNQMNEKGIKTFPVSFLSSSSSSSSLDFISPTLNVDVRHSICRSETMFPK